MTDYTKDSSIDPERMQQWTMASKLPYTLTTGVAATKEGIVFADDIIADGISFLFDARLIGSMWPWSDAAERLRYRVDCPWCEEDGDGIFCGRAGLEPWTISPLHRLAAILCEDSEAFRVLHWCVHNLSALQEAPDEALLVALEWARMEGKVFGKKGEA